MASQKIIRLLLLFLPILFITCGKNDEKPEEQLPPNNTLEIQQAIKSDTIKPAEMPLAQEVNQHDPVKAIPNPDDLAAWFDKSGIYTLQLSSWKTRSHAERDRKRFYDAGLDCRIEETVPPVRIEGGIVFVSVVFVRERPHGNLLSVMYRIYWKNQPGLIINSFAGILLTI